MHVLTRSLCAALALTTVLAGCGKKEEYADDDAAMSAPAPAMAVRGEMAKSAPPAAPGATADEAGGGQAEQAPRRYIALSHQIMIQTDADKVESAWRAAVKACEAAGCELLSSSLARENDAQAPRASLDARVPPQKLDGFLKQLSGLGSLGRHDTSAEDKTDAVVDTEARQKNMTELRDRLRQLLNTPGAKLSDIIEVEQKLAEVQSALDGLATLRKVLANETEKVRVTVSFEPRANLTRPATWQPLTKAIEDAGHTLSASLAAMLRFVIAALPWALLGLVLVLLVKRFRRRRQSAQ